MRVDFEHCFYIFSYNDFVKSVHFNLKLQFSPKNIQKSITKNYFNSENVKIDVAKHSFKTDLKF